MNSPRIRILNTTSILFHQQGYNRTGVNQIIAESKVAKASFYQYFKSKEDLCIEYLNERHIFWFNELRSFVSKTQSPKEKILKSFDFLIFMNEKENFRGCSFLNIISEISKEQDQIIQIIQNHKSDLRKYFQEEIKDELLSDQIYLLYESSIIESQVFKSNELIEKSKKIIQKLI